MSEPKPRILVVDDAKINRSILKDLLMDDYTVMLAKNGQQALGKANSDNPPDLILLDVVMPEMDGYEVCTRLKDSPKTKNIPVVFVTARQEDGDYEGLEIGGVDYISKPFSAALVLARIRNHLELVQAKKQLAELDRDF